MSPWVVGPLSLWGGRQTEVRACPCAVLGHGHMELPHSTFRASSWPPPLRLASCLLTLQAHPNTLTPRVEWTGTAHVQRLCLLGSSGICAMKQAEDAYFLGYWADSKFRQYFNFRLTWHSVLHQAFHVLMAKGSPWGWAEMALFIIE
ncbi:hypothetical protein HJG60_011962 [Phyllostomus discolor]|uniref:Uncharacterized protein n=1 Tax=Phyllostomus discolor TaxID=89673 RepID=A0A834DWJ0_9CHIR|nr:hypothetical protein HJG60_011962 [Phyllostomus discolor]